MKFGRVQGFGLLVSDQNETKVSVTVTLETGTSISVVREEHLPWLTFGPEGDLSWQIDQYTQETIGTILAEDGWEPFGEDREAQNRATDTIARSALYTVRNLSAPIVTWNDRS